MDAVFGFENVPILMDGGFGSALATRGYEVSGDPLWSAKALIDAPNLISDIHTEFMLSGCKILRTNSYQASVQGFTTYANLSTEQARALIHKSVTLLQDARDKINCNEVVIAGSIGPYGAYLANSSEYTGEYLADLCEEELIDFHRPRFEALCHAGCNFLSFETFPGSKEAFAVLRLLREKPDINAVLSFSCRNDGRCISSGENVNEVFQTVLQRDGYQQQLVAIGINCTSPTNISDIMSTLDDEMHKKLVLYPNGKDYVANVGWQHRPEHLSNFLEDWASKEAKIIGGCCHTTADDLKAANAVLNKWKCSRGQLEMRGLAND